MSSRLTAGGLKRLHDDGAGPSAAPAAPAELPSPICLELLGEPSRAALRAAYEASSPYRHGVLHPLCQDARLRGCFEEMQTHLSGTFKETDLFKARVAVLAVNPTACGGSSLSRGSPGLSDGRLRRHGRRRRAHPGAAVAAQRAV